MPTYNFKDSNTGEISEITMRISELDTFREKNPHLSIIHSSSSINIVRSSGKLKPDEGFRDVLKSIKKASGRGANINTF
jgi:hypothetical protein